MVQYYPGHHIALQIQRNMPPAKTYLRYVHEEAFGLVASARAPTVVDTSGNFAFAPGIHEVLVWDLKRGEQVRFMTPDGEGYLKGEVTALLIAGTALIAGYSNGMLRSFDAGQGGSPALSLVGHKGAVACLSADPSAVLLASGGNDTDIVVWDLVAERGVCRLRGHKDAVTAVRFLPTGPSDVTGALAAGGRAVRLLASSSKDALVKVWDLALQCCVQTIVGHRAEVWSLAVSPNGCRLVSGSNDEKLRVWSLGEDGTGGEAGVGGAAGEVDAASGGTVSSTASASVARFMGGVLRSSATDRCAALHFHCTGAGGGGVLLGAQSAGKLVDVYRVRSGEQAKKKLKRRMKRLREKAAGRADDDDGGGEEAAPGGAASPVLPSPTKHKNTFPATSTEPLEQSMISADL